MPNFPGATGARPGPYAETVTTSTGTSVPGGQRLAVLVGEGSRVERLISSAVGGGHDGLNPSYSSSNGSDGRHFALRIFPIISNRTVLFKNGVPLVGHEESITGTTFSSLYDYRLEIETGRIELQGAALVDQGGAFYSANSANVGNGTISSLTLQDVNAPTETWTVRCSSVKRDGYGNPIDGYAKFIAQGSISGVPLDGYGNAIVWQSNGTVTSNSILSFAINEGSTAFREGDKFIIKVKGGALSRGDSLVAHYIGVSDINDPEFFTDLDDLVAKHGQPSLENRLSLGAQLAFANRPPGVWACQAAPSVPRRKSYVLRESASGNSNADDLEFRLPLGVVPDADSNINFFVTDPVTETETQILPNKVDFYDAKGDLEVLFAELNLPHVSFCSLDWVEQNLHKDMMVNIGYTTCNGIHPGQSALIVANNMVIGWVGRLHPQVSRKTNIDNSVILFELSLEELEMPSYNCYKEISKMPSIKRDFAFLLETSVTTQQLMDVVKNTVGDLLKKMEIFDIYQGSNIQQGFKSVAFSLILQEANKTLVDNEIITVTNQVVDAVTKKLGGQLRE